MRITALLLTLGCAASTPAGDDRDTRDTGADPVDETDDRSSDLEACPLRDGRLELAGLASADLVPLEAASLRWWALGVVQQDERDPPVAAWLAHVAEARVALEALPPTIAAQVAACATDPLRPQAVPTPPPCERSCLELVGVQAAEGALPEALALAGARGDWSAWVRLAEGGADLLDRADARREVLTALQEVGAVDPFLTHTEADGLRAVVAWTAVEVARSADRHAAVAAEVAACLAAQDAVCRPSDPGDPVTTLKMRFVPLQGGDFWMGSPDSDPARDDDEPLHRVELTHRFLLGAQEVTREAWSYVTSRAPPVAAVCEADCAVHGVSWVQAAAFANRASDLQGLDRCYQCVGEGCVAVGDPYTCEGWRLPTEAEWEYAAREGGALRGGLPGGGTLRDPVAALRCDEVPAVYGREPLTASAWSCLDGEGRVPHRVGQRRPNALGLHDLSGNVWEWCHDLYGPLSSSPQTDPSGPPTGKNHVIRGGSFFDPPALLQLGNRSRATPDDGSPLFGFRLARTLDP